MKWHYEFETVDFFQVEHTLNKRGEAGWEGWALEDRYYGTLGGIHTVTLYFKRPVP